MAHGLELRRRVMKAVDEGHVQQAIAQVFGVSDRWIRRLIALRRGTGSLEPSRAPRGPKPMISGRLAADLGRLVEQTPDATLAQYRNQLGVDASVTTVWRALRRLDARSKNKR